MQQAHSQKRRDWIDEILLATLILTLAIGFFLRTYRMDWDRGHFYLFHPDERAMVYSAISNLSFPWPPDWSKLLRPDSPLNPHFFPYGSLPMYLTKGTAHVLSFFIKNAWTNENLWMAGRGLSAVFDIITIFLAYALGRKLYGRRVGLLAAIFGSFTVLHIQLSHFLTVDTFLTTFIILSMYFAVDIVRQGSLRAALLTGATLGLAMGTKVSVAPLVASIVVAWGVWVIRGSSDPQVHAKENLTTADRFSKAILGTLVAILAAGACFFVSEPYAIIDWTNFIRSVQEQSRMVRGIADYPYTRQYLNTPIFLYQIWQTTVWGMGIPLGLVCYAGFAMIVVRTLLKRRGEEIVLMSWVLIYFVINGIFQVKFLRYMLPLFPFLAIMGADLLWQLWDWAGRAKATRWPWHVPMAHAQEKEDSDYLELDAEAEAWEREKSQQAGAVPRSARRAGGMPPRRRARPVSLGQTKPPVTPDTQPMEHESSASETVDDTATALADTEESVVTPMEILSEKPLAPETSRPQVETEQIESAPADLVMTALPPPEEEIAPPLPVVEESGQEPTVVAQLEPMVAEAALPAVFEAPMQEPQSLRIAIASMTKGQWIVTAIMASVIVSTVFYALAFMNIYRQPHPWVTISDWIYRNIPPGSTIANEHWDDAIPLGRRVDGRQRTFEEYKHVEMKSYEDDNQAKLDMIVDNLQKTDYIVLATNRLYGTIPRLPERYPVTKRYYELLFAEKLGFQLVRFDVVYPSLLGVTIMNDTMVDPPLTRPPLLQQMKPSGLVINLGKADESFTVYDHPQPMVFKKVQQIAEDEMRAMFAGTVQAAQQYQIKRQTAARPSPVQRVAKTFLLTEKERDAQEAGGTYMELFNPNSLVNRSPVIFWWLAVELIALAALPIGFIVFGHLRDRGYSLIKALSILLVAYPPWLAASLKLLPFGRISIILSIALVGLVSGIILHRRREMLTWLRENRWLILTNEALFAAAFLVFVGIRVLNPDLWQPWNGGEKPMEFAFLGAIARSTYFPPYDPFFAGGYINYYYYGQYLGAMLIRLLGIMPSVGFNLIIPWLFALTVIGSFSITFNLLAALRKRVQPVEAGNTLGNFLSAHAWLLSWALAGALFVTVIGNPATLGEVFKGPYNKGTTTIKSSIPGLSTIARVADGLLKAAKPGQRVFESFNYWNPSRVIPDTINEFPYWSYLFADLHPHTIGIPFTLLVLGLLLNLIKERQRRPDTAAPTAESNEGISGDMVATSRLGSALAWIQARFSGIGWDDLLGLLVLALAVGSLGVINTWDLPTYLGVLFCIVLLRGWLDDGRVHLLESLGRFGAIAILGLVIYWPFYQKYQALASGIGLVRSRTPVGYYLAIFGFFLFVIISFMIIAARMQPRATLTRLARLCWRYFDDLPVVIYRLRWLVHPRQTLTMAGYALALLVVVLAALAVAGQWILVLLLPLLLATAVLALTGERQPERVFVWLLAFTGFLVSLGVEIFFLRDWLQGGSVYRMNTIFKFYIQVWVFLALVTAVGLAVVIEQIRFSTKRLVSISTVWYVCLAGLLFCVFLFPVLGTPARVTDRFPGSRPPVGTLDGTAFMSVGRYSFDWDRKSYQVDLRYDYDAIQWLLRNVKGSPVIAEAVLPYYRELGARVSAYTGMPTLIGNQHEQEQRPGDTQVGPRETDARTLYTEPSFERIVPLLKKHRVRYIYVGQLEQIYGQAGLAKFDQVIGQYLDLVYENPKVKIYRVRDL